MHILGYIVTSISIDKNKFLSLVNYRQQSVFLKPNIITKLNKCQEEIFNLVPNGRMLLLKERQKGTSFALVYYALSLLQNNANYKISFVCLSSTRTIENFLFVLNELGLEYKRHNNKFIFNNDSELIINKSSSSRGILFDLTICDQVYFEDVEICSKNIILALDYENYYKDQIEKLLQLKLPNENLKELYLYLLPDLTKNSFYKGINLIELSFDGAIKE